MSDGPQKLEYCAPEKSEPLQIGQMILDVIVACLVLSMLMGFVVLMYIWFRA